MTLSVELVVALLTVVFSAGGAWFVLRQVRKDCNGLGRKARTLEIALLLICPADRKDELLKFLAK